MLTRTVLLSLALLSHFFTSEPVQSQTNAASAVTTQQAESATTSMKKLVSFMKVDFQDGNTIKTIQGTSFFVSVNDKRLGENSGFVFLVTNRHMAEPEIDGRKVTVRKTMLRLNLKTPARGIESEELEIPLGTNLHWYFPTDDAVDLALLPLMPNQTRYDYKILPVSLLATGEMIRSEHVSEGDNVLFAGFFYQFPGQKKMEPIVRQGILAMVPDELLETTRHKPGRLYLADAHVFGGNSGSPMFVRLGGFRNGGLVMGPTQYALLGVISGYFCETADFKLQVATTLTGMANTNSGISMVVPADELKALLESPNVAAYQDEQVKQFKAGHSRSRPN